ncbi:---NA--- [Octopus vulgaris]|uniref:---NA n=1 Tax=Octopus vulgaris TaxID=6645 RepID=A0AA36AUP4_OCTVU|nr:---NA--- [Octopus vulgaris]
MENIRLRRILEIQITLPVCLKQQKFSEIEQQKRKILALKVEGMSNQNIAGKIRRSKTPATSERNERAIVRAVKKSRCSSVSKIKTSAGEGTSTSTVRKVILNHGFHLKKRLAP